MNAHFGIPQFLLACALDAATVYAGAADTNRVALGRHDVQFSQSAPYVTTAEIKRRFGVSVPTRDYEITGQKFQLFIPEAYATNSDWGLLVWISPGDQPRIPSDWDLELAKHRLLFVSAYDSGNNRPVVNRIRLALDATCNVCRQFKIDRRRIYIGCFSGGSRMASMIGIAYPDIFAGTLCICGVDFYRPVPTGVRQYYPATFLPDAQVLSLAKKSGRFVLLTGESDFNRENTKAVLEKGFKPNGFAHVLYLEVPGMKHAIPGPTDLNTALEFLDGTGEKSTTPRRDP